MSVFRVEAGDGEPVLLLHGYPESASCWRHQIPALAQRHRVIAVDWPGFGRSDPPDTPATYENEVGRLDCLVDSLGLRRFNLVAHDYGAFLGLGYVLRHPQKVMRLAVLNSRAQGLSTDVLSIPASPTVGRDSCSRRRAQPSATAATSRRVAPVPPARVLRRCPPSRVFGMDGHAARAANVR